MEAGYKLNLTDIQSAPGLAQLKKADQFARARRELAEFYLESLSGIEELEMPPQAGFGSEHSWHLFILRLQASSGETRSAFIDELKHCGVGTSVHFIPLHLHPYYRNAFGYRPGDFPQAEDAYYRCVSLPIYPDLTSEERAQVVRAVEQAVLKTRERAVMAA